jgi:cytochrome b involved in lipid metabolism
MMSLASSSLHSSFNTHANKTFTLDQVSWHDQPHDCWVVIYDVVYDVTAFLQDHPGGAEVMLEHAGRDATFAFQGVGHSRQALKMLVPFTVGVLVEGERLFTRG